MFEDVSTFDGQNPIVPSFLRELDVGKKDIVSEVIKKKPTPGVDLSIQKRLDVLRNENIGFNKKDNNNNNGGLPLCPPSPPSFNNFILPPQFPPLPLPSFNSFQHFNFPPPPPLPSSPLSPPRLPRPRLRSSATLTQPSTHFGEMTLTKTKIKPEKEHVLEDIDVAIY